VTDRLLAIVVCGAGPAAQVGILVDLAHERGWRTQIIATPSALPFLDLAALEEQTGRQVRSDYRTPEEPRSSEQATGFIVAPATFNTINKLTSGISDTYALGVLGEAIGAGSAVVIVPFINTALANRLPLQESIRRLKSENVSILGADHGNAPHPPHTGSAVIGAYPWQRALTELERRLAGL